MKKKIVIIIIAVLVTLAGISIYIEHSDNLKYTKDELKFKAEYEKLNTKNNISLNISKNNNIEYINASDVIKKLQKGTSVIYFGFPDCPWCRNLAPVLIEVNKDYNMPLYYFNASKIRDNKHLDKDGKIIIDKKGTAEYYKILDLLKDYLDPYAGLNDDNIKRLYFPTVVFIKDGKIIDVHLGTVKSQKDQYKVLTKDQKKELIKNLESSYDKVTTGICEKDAKC